MKNQNRERMSSKKRCPVDNDIHANGLDGYGIFTDAKDAKDRSKKLRRNIQRKIILSELISEK